MRKTTDEALRALFDQFLRDVRADVADPRNPDLEIEVISRRESERAG